MHKKCENAKKCEMRMLYENGIKIRIASHYCYKKFRIFAFFRIAFASHYHPWPPAPIHNVPVNVYDLSTPICPILGVCAYQVESSTCGCLIIVLPEFNGRGGGPPS
jgi:hypothetical protein